MARRLRPLALSVAALGALCCGAALAAPVRSDIAKVIGAPPAAGATVIAGRKGTRTYEPDDALEVPMETPSATVPGDDDLEECMRLWDRDTHMTKAEWRGSCIRLLRERGSKPGI